MLIAQLTDIHLGFEVGNPTELNRQRLDRAIEALLAIDPAPDLLIASGDLTDRGEEDSYRQLSDALSACPFPVLPCVGNHDLRETFLAVFPETRTADGFVQYTVEDWPLRIVVIDTVGEGRHGGDFCETRAQWLDDRLSNAPGRPTLIVMHHPPIDTGIEWMTSGIEDPWAQRLSAVVSRHGQVVGAVCGHIHRPIVTRWAGTILVVCPSIAPQVVLDLNPMHLDQPPDNRPMVAAEPPGYALHIWRGDDGLLTHFGGAGEAPVLARYEERMQRLARSYVRENDHAPRSHS